jgi:hypothetical protein
VVGVGTTAGGTIPDPKRDPAQPPIRSVLDRNSLSTIATAGGGRYFELDRDPDRDIANAIIDLTRRRADGQGVQQGMDDRYREFLMLAAGLLVLGVLFLRERGALALTLASAGGLLAMATRLF